MMELPATKLTEAREITISAYKIGNGIILRADLHTERFTSQQRADILKADERNDKPACCREGYPIPRNPLMSIICC